jgi:hypothetical protein
MIWSADSQTGAIGWQARVDEPAVRYRVAGVRAITDHIAIDSNEAAGGPLLADLQHATQMKGQPEDISRRVGEIPHQKSQIIS